jgi:ATP-dependent DNA helicase DinG
MNRITQAFKSFTSSFSKSEPVNNNNYAFNAPSCAGEKTRIKARQETPKQIIAPNDESVVSNTYRVYKSYIKSKKYNIRDGQQSMVKFIDKEINGTEIKMPLLVEAGTGTGKTVSYSIPSILHGLENKKKVIIATATVALQSQILEKDLPDILEHSSLDFTHVVAKGRSHFVCLEKLANGEGNKLLERAQKLIETKSWEGDRDSLDINVNKKQWAEMTMDKHGCLGKQCPTYDECPYYKARAAVQEADVIVTNHAFLLSDLAMGGGIILPAPEDSIYAIDEFHNFAESGKNYFAKDVNLTNTFNEIQDFCKTIKTNSSDAKEAGLNTEFKNIEMRLRSYQKNLQQKIEFVKCQEERTVICDGIISPVIQNSSRYLHKDCKGLRAALADCLSAFDNKDNKQKPKYNDLKENTKELLAKLSELIENDIVLWACFSRSDKGTPLARWIDNTKDGFTLSVSPINASRALEKFLWSRAYQVIGASATITVNGSFDTIMDQIGVQAKTLKVASPFDYEKQAVLEMAPIKSAPNSPEFQLEVINYLNKDIDETAGTLILFTSIKQMREVSAELKPELKNILLMQGEYQKSKIIEMHKKRINQGKGSMIFGVDSFSEGLDLAGRALTHVVCVKIKFDLPNDPISMTAHWHYKNTNRNPFADLEVPKAATRLVQSVGRLIRTEKDSGKITLLDNRLVKKGYGKIILGSLPMKISPYIGPTTKAVNIASVEESAIPALKPMKIELAAG